VSDRIQLTIDASAAVADAAKAHEKLVRSETLATEVVYGKAPDGAVGKVGEGLEVRIGVAKRTA